jgi:hypothetical protein
MPRRIKPKETKRDWRWWASTLLNGAVVVSMVLGTIFVFAGVPTRAVPTLEVPTAAPTTVAPPTVAPPPVAPSATPTPKASADYQFAVTGISRDGDVVYNKLLKRFTSDATAVLIHTGDLMPSRT